ncbi:Rieske (2Fe-2S) protein [Streptomyces sp. NPDC059009]|uniref:Rieske (2Fe-2S) protein n=1 Tax=Streptomyces sp. NPDC059009 TaxID=3346694 RepID=UPI0036B9648B
MTTPPEHHPARVPTPSRRTVVAAVGAAGVAAALTACGSDDGSKDTSQPAGAAGETLGTTSEIPVGGGKIFKDAGVVVTQPTEGEFKAFSSRCTHKGCAVTSVSSGTINCPCHGSRFAVADGSVRHGPAPKPLPALSVKVDGDALELGDN